MNWDGVIFFAAPGYPQATDPHKHLWRGSMGSSSACRLVGPAHQQGECRQLPSPHCILILSTENEVHKNTDLQSYDNSSWHILSTQHKLAILSPHFPVLYYYPSLSSELIEQSTSYCYLTSWAYVSSH